MLPADDTRGFCRNVENVCFNVSLFVCALECVCVCVCVCVMGENVCGCTLSPRNSICVVNALFKTINIHSGLYTIKDHEVCVLMCVCVCLCVCVCVCVCVCGCALA